MKKIYVLLFSVFILAGKSFASVPDVPTDLAVNVSCPGVSLSWSGVADSFRIYVYRNDALYAILSSGGTSLQIPHLNAGTTYEVKVSAFNLEGESAQSIGVIFTTASAPSAPVLSNRRVYSNGVDLYWTVPSGEISGYYVSIYIGYNTNGTRLVKFSQTNPYYYFSGGSGTFTFVVSAYNCAGESPMSNSLTFTFSYLKSASAYASGVFLKDESIESPKSERLVIYPSPASDQLFVDGVSDFEVSIFSMDGKKVLEVNNANESIDISKLKQGIYIIHLKSEGDTFIRKFVKQ